MGHAVFVILVGPGILEHGRSRWLSRPRVHGASLVGLVCGGGGAPALRSLLA